MTKPARVTTLLLTWSMGVGCVTPLGKLSADLEMVRASTPTTEPVDVRPSFDASFLVGKSRKEILAALPDPDRCDWPPPAREGTCDSYSFHKLPPVWSGGGTVLNIMYDAYGRCVRAAWIATM